MPLDEAGNTASRFAKLWYELGYEYNNLLYFNNYWWRRRESNPRPSALGRWLYMLSCVYCFSPFDDPTNRVSMGEPLKFSDLHRSDCRARSCVRAPDVTPQATGHRG